MASTAQEIALMKQRMDSVEEKLDSLANKMDNLAEQLLDPDDGFVVRVNKNTHARLQKEKMMPVYNKVIQEFKDIQSWKQAVNRALWVVYTAVICGIIALVFA